MIAMYMLGNRENKNRAVKLWSIDKDYNFLTLKISFPGEKDILHFTPDDKHIVYGSNDILWFWNIAETEITTKFKHISYNNGSIKKYIEEENLSLDSQRCQRIIVVDSSSARGVRDRSIVYV
eukprot:CAMPEP_0170885284 /NCGR_PEP_ID=MMETSP0734-20130129/35735_1 /TAXON_ID=186038 /ORGANISM="Fragilariopsis kerguelensis, Strain L26-C5" /LENGTH=121 /DNA_ID=CAMNT_0011270561 /DNA_START=471 /DNA_END=832 /DNA_ORIENTATION=-